MRKFLLAIVAVIGAGAAAATQAAVISVVNPTLPIQPPPIIQPVTPALSSAARQQPFPFSAVPAPGAAPASSSSHMLTGSGARPNNQR